MRMRDEAAKRYADRDYILSLGYPEEVHQIALLILAGDETDEDVTRMLDLIEAVQNSWEESE